MRSIVTIFPPPSELITLPAEDVAAMLLEYLNERGGSDHNRYNLTYPSGDISSYAGTAAQLDAVVRVIEEAWGVLEADGLLARTPAQSTPMMYFVTRRGKTIKNRSDFQSYRLGNLLPPQSLDPVLAEKVRPLFLSGDYETAVFRSYREVEERVRTAGGFGPDKIGVQLMRDAFQPGTGPLADKAAVKAEQESTQHLFAGAIGIFKNPSSHRSITYEAREAASLIAFANYLLTWVQRISPQRGSP